MDTSQLFTFAFLSRLCIIFLQILANGIIPDHDAGVFDPPKQNATKSLDVTIDLFFGGLRRWDAVYFTHIAEQGYTYENCVAFFPFYPMVVSLFSRPLPMTNILQLQQSILFVGIFLNCVLFSLAAVNLYSLGIETGLDKITSLLSVIVYCINPASIFMTAPYSESLYFFLLSLSLLYIKKGSVFLPSVFIALSVLTRSNGLVGIGFILHSILQNFISEFFGGSKEKKYFRIDKRLFFLVVHYLPRIILCLVTCFSPFLLYQYYIYTQFCFMSNPNESISQVLIDYGRVKDYRIAGELPPSPWCFQKFPLSYSYIQAKHWGVGFLNYYCLKQIPNFLLAGPVVLMSLKACLFFFRMNPKAFHTLGLIRTDVGRGKEGKQPKSNRNFEEHLANHMVVYVVHLAFLTAFGCVFIHIQVLTRLLFSSTPLLYWYSGFILAKNTPLALQLNRLIALEPTNKDGGFQGETDGSAQNHQLSCVAVRRLLNQCSQYNSYNSISSDVISSNVWFKIFVSILQNWTHLSWSSKAIIVYCISYCVLGTIMFSNFLPWT